MVVGLLENERVGLPKLLDARLVAVFQDRLTDETVAGLLGEVALVVHEGEQGQPELQARHVILLAVARRGVNQAGAAVGGDVVAPATTGEARPYMGCVYSKPTSALPGTVHTVSSVRPHVLATSRSQALRHDQRLAHHPARLLLAAARRSRHLRRIASSLSLTATAALAGMVHGVVVHTARDAPASSTARCSAGKPAGEGSGDRGNAT